MKLVLEDEEVDQYFDMVDENKKLLTTVNDLAYKLTIAEQNNERMKELLNKQLEEE